MIFGKYCPTARIISKTEVEEKYNAIINLHKRCNDCELLRNKEPDDIFTYTIYPHVKGEEMLMVAISQYNQDKIIAVYVPDELRDYSIFKFILRDVLPYYYLVVFTQRSYDAVKKYDKSIKVVLAT